MKKLLSGRKNSDICAHRSDLRGWALKAVRRPQRGRPGVGDGHMLRCAGGQPCRRGSGRNSGCWGSVFVGGRHTAWSMRFIRGSSCPGRAAHPAGWRLSPTVMRVASCTSGHCQPQGFGRSSRRIAGDARPASLLAESHAADRAHAGRWSAPGAVAGRFQGLLEGCTKWGIRIRSSRPDLHVTSAEGIRIGHP